MQGIIDVVFKQNYEKRVEAHVQKVATHNRMLGRQQGWTDAIAILNKLDELGMDKNTESFIALLQSHVLNDSHDAEVLEGQNTMSHKDTNKTKSKDVTEDGRSIKSQSSPNLSLVP